VLAHERSAAAPGANGHRTGIGLFYVVAIGGVIPRLEEQKVVADMARWMADRATPETHICSYRLNRWNNSLLFYVNRRVDITDVAEAVGALAGSENSYLCLMTASARDELMAKGLNLPVLYTSVGLWATSGRSLQRARPAPTTFVVVGRDTSPRGVAHGTRLPNTIARWPGILHASSSAGRSRREWPRVKLWRLAGRECPARTER
jgi:hypothetical protein